MTRPARTAVAATATRVTATGTIALLVAALLTAAGVVLAADARADADFVSMINSARASAGLPPLASRGDLAGVAASWSRQMASSGTLAHNPSLASQVSGYRYVGENVGYGPDAGTIHRAFMNSAPHRANILDGDYTEVGVAVVESDGRLWVTQVFRAPSGAPRAAAPAKAAPAAGAKAATPTSSRPAGRPASRPAAPAPPPPPSPEDLLRQRAAAAVAGPGAARAVDPVQRALRFAEVMRATRG